MNKNLFAGPDDELSWLAFRYVKAEMTAAEEEHFEKRLADDQAAREAVEQAVQLTEAIRLVRVDTAPIPAKSRFAFRRVAVWAAGLAACLLLTVGLSRRNTTHTRPSQAQGNGATGNGLAEEPRASVEVARAWAELRRTQDDEPLEPETSLPEGAIGMGDVTETDVDVPQWMLTAFATRDKRE